MRYSVIAAKDGDTYHDSVEADNQDEAEKKAREQLAEAWNMQETLQSAIDDEDLCLFDAELDGFAVDPDPDPIQIVAQVFALAKDAPTSFEPEEWIDGFQDGRRMIAERIALHLRDITGFNEQEFLKACDLTADEEEPEEPAGPKFAPGTQVYIRRIGKTMTVIRSERPYGHEQRYVLRNRDNQIESQWREDELELADEDRAVKCDNCDWKGTETECNEAKDLSERLDPGCEVPAGECPECGCLAYLVKEQPEPVYQRSANSGIEWPIPAPMMRDEGDLHADKYVVRR